MLICLETSLTSRLIVVHSFIITFFLFILIMNSHTLCDVDNTSAVPLIEHRKNYSSERLVAVNNLNLEFRKPRNLMVLKFRNYLSQSCYDKDID